MNRRLPMILSAAMALLALPVAVQAKAAPEVAVVRSDWKALEQPVPVDSVLGRAQIEVLVRRAIAELGGISRFVKPEHRWVVIKPNIVEISQRGSGDITDSYVVWALVKMVHEAAPAARITIAEGPAAWILPGHPEIVSQFNIREVDGFAETGYRAILADSALAGARVDLVDLNLDESVELPVPGGGEARDRYYIPKTVLDCDVFIDVPVLKVTNSIGFTCAMKNLVGICPGTRYGWGKNQGNPPGSGTGIPHTETVFDEMIVDLTALGRIDLAVVDATVAMGRGRVRDDGGVPMRMNAILAGADPVAVDAVALGLAGMNPDDFEFITLGERRGLGVGDLERIVLRGQPLDEVKVRLEKKPDDRARFGQSNRTWLLRGPFPLTERDPVDPAVHAYPEQDGWSAPIYFGDDRIDLRSAFPKAVDCAVYAYAEFTASRTEAAEVWAGSGEGLTIWIDGQQILDNRKVRQHRLPNDKQRVELQEGRHSLLVRTEQTRGSFDFSLNLCEVEPDERYAGNRVFGLRFSVPQGERVSEIKAAATAGFRIEEWLEGHVPEWLDRAVWTSEKEFEGKRISSIAFGPDSSIWVAAGNGISHREGTGWRTWGRKEGLDADWVAALAVSPAGHVWAMSGNGTLEFDGEKWHSRFQGGSFKGGLAIDPQGRIWTGGYQRGVSVYDGQVARTYEYKDGLPNINVMGVAADQAGRIWLATYGGGAIRFDGQDWRAYTAHGSGLGDNHTLCIALDRQGNPWVGADAGGVSHLEGERWTAYGKEEGLGDASASFIAVDQAGIVWVAIGGWDTRERDGISIFDGRSWVTGLSNEAVNCIGVDPRGDLWFGSRSGLTRLSLEGVGR